MSHPGSRPWLARGYRMLLRVFEPEFRARHGAEMERLFLARLRDAGREGRRGAFLAGAIWDAVRSGIATRLDARGWTTGGGARLHRTGERRQGWTMDSVMNDLRYALRTLTKNPGFTVVAVVTIGLGIGANTAIFSVVRAVLMGPLPYADAERLVMVHGAMRTRGVTEFPMSPPDYRDIRDQSTVLEDAAAVFTFAQSLTGDGAPVQVQMGLVTHNFFDLLGVAPALGREFGPDDDRPNEQGIQPGQPGALPSVAVLSHALWQQRFGGDPQALGRTIDVGGVSAEVVGVMPPAFELLMPPGAALARDVEVWLAGRLDYDNAPRNNVFLRVVGRLRPDATLEQAQAELDRIASGLAAENEAMAAAGFAIDVEPLAAGITADVRPVLLALFGAVGFVLLIACANVANLLLVRASARERELAVRAALGGSRVQLIRQMLLESGLLALAGAAVGVALAALGIEALLAMVPAELPRVDQVGIDGVVLGFTFAAAVGAALVFGVVPAVQASRVELADALKDRGQASTRGSTRTIRNAVVVGEVALSTVLLIGAGLMLRSFVALSSVDPGYDAEEVLTFDVSLPFGRYPSAGERDRVMTELRRRMAAVPGVEAVSAVFPLPLDDDIMNGRYGLEDALSDPSAFRQAAYRTVRPGYFEAMGTPVLEGRTFTEADHADSTLVVVVDELLAQKLWPGESAVGKRMLIRAITPEPEWVEVVGVVQHQRSETLAADGMEQVFFTDRYFGGFASAWVVRAGLDAALLAPALRGAVDAVDPDLPLASFRRLQSDVDRAMGPTTFALTLIGLFGVIALVLASVGLYGVLAYVVRQRSAEIGVRMAFGAQAESILALVVRQGLGLAGAGLVLGLVVAVPLSGVLEAMLVGVAPTDAVTFVGISAVFAVVALLACWIPARRATRVDPVQALRDA
ncbi:MAG: ABC transporter permease [Longimicrobiales bacterium]